MNNVNKKYDVGTLSLAEPYFHFIHNLPLLSFGDVLSSVDLSLVFNSKNKTENNFNITNGFKLNLQKRLIINTQNGGSTKISLEDENGMIHYCKYVNDSVYVVHDYGKSVLRKDLIGGKIKYILEYANMSKEIFDSNGNIESLVDKYNNVLLTYNYDEKFTLKSIVYRTNKEVNFEYTNEKLTAIKYLVKNTNVCTITITYNNLGVIVRHYSGTDFHIETAANPFVAYSTERNATVMTANCKKISCTKGQDKTFTKNIGNIAYKKELVYNCGMVRSVTDTKSVGGIKSDLGTVEYAYDAAGRIVRATNAADGTSISYVYDSIGRLVRENNAQLNGTYVYQYDALGNVVSKKTYAFTENTLPASAVSQINFTYSSTDPDRLTSFGNKSISYDYQGCPISYSDKKYTWSSGKLSQIAIGDINIGRESFSYTYNGNGLRTKKTYYYMPPRRGPVPAYYIANKTTSYFYDHSGRLLEEHSTTTENNGSSETSDLVYFYDACGIAGFVHNGSTYYLHRNLHGDVESIFDSTGTLIASYRYDAWGNHKVYGATGAENTSSTFIGNINPIRYRGYYFDVETNMYFCNARYYVPEWCRWLSQDSVNFLDPDSADGLNLFAYCNNNPVMFVDPEGTSWRDFTKWVSEHALIVEIVAIVAAVAITVASWGSATPVAAMVIGGIVGGGIGALNAVAHDENVLAGALTGAFVGFVGGAHWALAALAAFGTTFTRARVNKVQITSEVVDNAFLNAASASLLSLVSSHAYNYFLDPTPIVGKALYNMTYPIENVIGVAGFSSLFFSNVNWAVDLVIEHILGK